MKDNPEICKEVENKVREYYELQGVEKKEEPADTKKAAKKEADAE